MEEIAQDVFVETGYQGVNVGAIITEKGIVCIDAPSYPRDARNWASYLERKFARPIRYLILTDCHGDRILNARWLNAPIVAHQYSSDRLFSYEKRYPQLLLDSLIQRNPPIGKELTNNPVDRPSISFTERIDIVSENHIVTVEHRPGPSPGTAWVDLNDGEVLFTGDSVANNAFPPLNELLLTSWLNSLVSLLDKIRNKKVLIVPGRGAVGDDLLVEAMINYLNQLASVVQKHIDEGGLRESLKDRVEDVSLLLPEADLPFDWMREQIETGLMEIFDQFTYQPNNGSVA